MPGEFPARLDYVANVPADVIANCKGVIESAAGAYFGVLAVSNLSKDDLRTFARLGVCKAWHDWEHRGYKGKGIAWATFVNHRARYAVLDFIRLEPECTRARRHREHAQAVRSAVRKFDAPYQQPDAPLETGEEIDKILKSLPPQHGDVLRLRLSGKLQKETAELLGLSESRISQIESESVEFIAELYDAPHRKLEIKHSLRN